MLRNIGIGAALAALTLAGCGTAEDSSLDSGEDFLEAVPEGVELELSFDDAATDEAPEDLPDGAPRIRRLTVDVFHEVNGLIRRTRGHIREALDGVEPETFEEGKLECKRWETDGAEAHWRFTSCVRDAKNRHYAFRLEGRPLDGGDFATVFAGEGKAAARFDGKKRGHGTVLYDLDQLHALTGEGPTGKIGIGYRAVGRVRQLALGLRDVTSGEDAVGLSARYRYRQIAGIGGHVRLLAHGDVVTETSGSLALGEDGVAEWARVNLGWRRDVGARAAVAVCGGTVGEGECVQLKQCWDDRDVVASESLGDDGRFDRACAQGPVPVEDAPTEDEVAAPDALPVEEPAPDPME
jgi:hypothetical protein